MEFESLTYHEVAERLDIKIESARRIARQKKWKKVTGNDGLARIMVPIDRLAKAEEAQQAALNEPQPVDPALVLVLEERIAGLISLVEAERQRAATAELRVIMAESRSAELAIDRDAWKAEAGRGILSRAIGRR